MTPQQIDNLKTDIDTNTKSALGLAIGTLLVPRLVDLQDRTSPDAISQGVQKGVCNSLNGGNCPGGAAVTQGLGGMQQALQAGMAGLDAALLAQGAQILGVVKDTNGVIRHSSHGLQAVQGFAKRAWRSTRLGKVLDILTLSITLHNAAMLSRNLAGSLGDIISEVANNTISLITNEDSDPINLNETIGNSVEGFLKSILGESSYNNLSETFSKYNRVINAAANITHSILSVQAGLADGLETIGSYTGKIGNSLKKSGAVLEGSYTWMSEKISVKSGRLGAIQKVLDLGESAENVASDIANATSEFRDVQESITQIGGQSKKIKDEITAKETEKNTAETDGKTGSRAAQPNLADFTPDPIDD